MKALLVDICEGMHEAALSNKNRLPYGHVTNLLVELKPKENWLTRNIINKAFIKYRCDKKKMELEQQKAQNVVPDSISGIGMSLSTLSELSNVSSTQETSTRKAGRPVGSTEAKKETTRKNIIEAKNEVTRRFAAVKEVAKKRKERVKHGVLMRLIDEVSDKRGVNKEKILPNAIRRRVDRHSLHCHHLAGGQVSPLARIEPTIIGIIVQMARMRQCLTPSRALSLINSLIKDTPIQQELIAWKATNTPNTSGTVGKGYWRNFLKRNKNKIVSKRGQKYELNRQNWTTYTNFVHMYNNIIDEMVDAGVAEKLDEPVWMDRDGNICSEQEAYGCKVHHQIVRPDMCLCGDEVGGNISMKGDGHVGGELFVTEKGRVPQRKVSTKNRKFTMIGLTALTGDPVMCVIIIEGTRPNASIEAGIDITIQPKGDPNDPDFILKNSGKGCYLPGGPECWYKGKKVPALVRWHESGSITSQILVEILKTLDLYNLFPRNDGVKPFLLLDGHGSRLELPFLQYINNPADHWIVCIGVPYGTSLWQVGDSKEQNGSFNMSMTKGKQILLEKKDMMGLHDEGILDTDMMPLINYAWERSFARVQKNKNAICDRGWNPLNRVLLLDPDLNATRTVNEKSTDYQLQNNIIIPNKDRSASNDTVTTGTNIETETCTNKSKSLNNPPLFEHLNFSSGESSFCLKSILSQQQLQEAREKMRDDMERGKDLKEKLKNSKKRLSAGIVFKAGTSRLGKTVFDIHRENIDDKVKKAREKMRKEEQMYKLNVEKANEILSKNIAIENMTIKQLTIICKQYKRKEDGKMPNKKDELIKKYKEWCNRPAPNFDMMNDDVISMDINEDNDIGIDIDNTDNDIVAL